MTDQNGFSDRSPTDAQDAATGPYPAERIVLQKSVQKINDVLAILDEAIQTPVLLDRLIEIDDPDLLPESYRAYGDAARRRKVSRAGYLYLIAVTCRDTVRDIKEYLHDVGWTEENEEGFANAFIDLTDAWGTYQEALSFRYEARWDKEPSPVRALAELQGPRRHYIVKLDAYRNTLSVAVSYLEQSS